jgi:hypothetical protein
MVTLSGGTLGGSRVDGAAWEIGDALAIDGELYRRVDEEQAVYCGLE